VEYIADKHAALVAAYRQAEAETDANVWSGRDDAINRVITFDTRLPEQD
jgi:hypothetical protein